ncbi:response regulator transcription factor [Xanthomarina sp.]|uniref:response regulator transcription factor n=1 Tax=Xanthomarina sp. TaxID=1931211 RepID=UPI002C374507|nr:response regulator transcription factor [Xanthomarina sp.]HLV40511.1 response regulator transcription factor [Xanthomarina sp.]
MITVYITDDHPIVLGGIKNLIESQDDIELKGVFQTGNETLLALKTDLPDVLLLDINLPDANGIELSKKLLELYPELKIIILSVHNEKPVIASVLQHGVSGYVLKNSLGEDIIAGIKTVAGGATFLCVQTQKILDTENLHELEVIPKITRREKEILQHVADGYTTAQIGEKLFISPHTVESHRKNLMEKFDVSSMNAVVKYALEFKLL